MAILGPKPLVNPFGKMSIFRLFEVLVFIALKGVLSIQNIVKVIFLTYSAYKKILEKWPFLHQNHGLTLWKNVNFSTFGTSCFYCLETRFFNLEYRKSHFPNLQCLKKRLEKWPYLNQNHGLILLEKFQFFEFFNVLFLLPTKALFRSRLSQKLFS